MSAADNDRIQDEAADWRAQRDEGFSARQAREFEQWRRRGPQHAAAIARLEKACALMARMPLVKSELGAEPDAAGVVVAFPCAESLRGAGAAARLRPAVLARAAAIVCAALAWWQWMRPAAVVPESYATSAGGYERVALPDGSVLELNADSRVQVNFAAAERRVTLVAGEAHFTVARDAARPFIVDADGVAVRAVGTAFNVRLGTGAVEVLVTEGKVHVGAEVAEAPSAPAPIVEAGHRAVLPTRALAAAPDAGRALRIDKLEPAALREALAWQERKLVFADTPLHEVVAQLNRRNRVQSC